MTQKKAVFYVLLQAHKEDPAEYIPAWKFTGEAYIQELGEYFFMSYKCPANGVCLYFENPGLVERRLTTGRSGAKYYEYRLVSPFSKSNIKDESIKKFCELLGEEGEQPVEIKNTLF